MDDGPAKVFFTILLFGLFVPWTLSGLCLLWTRYKKHPYFVKRGRIPVTIETFCLGFSFLIYCCKCIYDNDTLDNSALYLYYLFGFFGLSAVLYRLIQLYFALTVPNLITKMPSQRLNDPNQQLQAQRQFGFVSPAWIRKYKRYFTVQNAVIATIIVSGIGVSFIIFVLKTNPALLGRGPEIKQDKWLRTSYSALFDWILMTILCSYMAYLLSKTGVENFGIKKELKLKVVCAGIIIFAVYVGLQARVKQFSADHVDVRMIVSWPAMILEIYITVWKVIMDIRLDIRSDPEESVLVSTTATNASERKNIDLDGIQRPDNVSLDQMIRDPEFLSVFTEFLCRELSVEHLFFILQVQEWKSRWAKVTQPDAAQWAEYVEAAEVIVQNFVADDAIAPVNINYTNRRTALEDVQKLSTGGMSQVIDVAIFDKACDEVVNLLQFDSMSRFKRDPVFQSVKARFKPASPSKLNTTTTGTTMDEIRTSDAPRPVSLA
eukprot:TRINITY_DN46812_c0_g1_i2.p1 TRINITY_DN46812_c0_g1~~TRINITY_DN46812_c0_g1_i2.p1  ORF type:complete len:507 (+),score=127.15 TRINITY_DN46812_c0_g1_i2:52-1521(+)